MFSLQQFDGDIKEDSLSLHFNAFVFVHVAAAESWMSCASTSVPSRVSNTRMRKLMLNFKEYLWKILNYYYYYFYILNKLIKYIFKKKLI